MVATPSNVHAESHAAHAPLALHDAGSENAQPQSWHFNRGGSSWPGAAAQLAPMDDPGSDHLVGAQRDATVGTKKDPAEGRVLFNQECDLVSTLIGSSQLQGGWERERSKA